MAYLQFQKVHCDNTTTFACGHASDAPVSFTAQGSTHVLLWFTALKLFLGENRELIEASANAQLCCARATLGQGQGTGPAPCEDYHYRITGCLLGSAAAGQVESAPPPCWPAL